VLVSQDRAWWMAHPDALKFEGRKWSGAPDASPVEGVPRFTDTQSGQNSGLLGIKAAVHLGATKVLLAGFDMHGTHFFGPHPKPLKNTQPLRFQAFMRQFDGYRPRGVEIINCTPRSALTCYPTGDLLALLAEPSAS
jgi:hypothetical protein